MRKIILATSALSITIAPYDYAYDFTRIDFERKNRNIWPLKPMSITPAERVEVIVSGMAGEFFHQKVPGDYILNGLKYIIGRKKGIDASNIHLFLPETTDRLDDETKLESLLPPNAQERKLRFNAVISESDSSSSADLWSVD